MSTILFLCPHNAAKSLLASAYFNQLAQANNVGWVADSAGTEPSEHVLPIVSEMLLANGIDVTDYQPRLVTPTDLQNARRIVSMGCTPEVLGVSPDQIEMWTDVPAVSQNPQEAHRIIYAHIATLIEELKAKR